MGKHGDKKKKRGIPPPDSFRARKAGCICKAYVVKPMVPFYTLEIECPIHGFIVKQEKERYEKFYGMANNWTKLTKPRSVWEWENTDLKRGRNQK